ncbi:MAG: hypothetical protein Ct9H300mP12_12220 [Acidimicrobiales bacterium]|nr:MAG: hypothetical protein Ct9H300mP12_12220 [Acidimicrobiales bacterium]
MSILPVVLATNALDTLFIRSSRLWLWDRSIRS